MAYAYEWKIWCMEWNQIFHIPYLHILIRCCWSPVFVSVEHISRQSPSSTRTVIRKLRAFFMISVTNSNVDAKRRSFILILFSWGQGTLWPDFCMFTSVLLACHCVRRDSYLASIASMAHCNRRPDLASCDKRMYIMLRCNNWKRNYHCSL